MTSSVRNRRTARQRRNGRGASRARHAAAARSRHQARFDREAKILAALNHPNIAVIYGLVESPNGRALVTDSYDGDDASRSHHGIYDHLLPHAEQVKVAHPLMLRAIAAGQRIQKLRLR